MPRITLKDVTKSYGAVTVLPPLNLELADGEFTVLVGPSGCGKSTTLRILAGLESMSSGEIFFDDKPIGRLDPKDRNVAMVFQDYALYPHMNIAQNMSFALRLARVNKAEIAVRVERVARMLNIAHLLHRKPAELSGGQRQRVAMGRAMVRDAGTFLFDEPLSNLDAKLRARMRTELAEMRRQIDKNMVYVTHDQVEAMTLGDRIVVMSEGRVQQQGAPEELFRRPVNKFVAGFIGSPTMTFLSGELVAEQSSLWVRGQGFLVRLGEETAARLRTTNTSGQVEIGIRPSAISADVTSGSPIELTIAVVEFLGSQTILVTRCGGVEVLVEASSDLDARPGDVRTFSIMPEEIMVFDAATGLRL